MERIVPICAGAMALLLFMTAPLDAQRTPVIGDRAFSVEVRGGYGIPVGDFSDDLGAQADLGFGTAATLMLGRSFGLYGGWGSDFFGCDLCDGNERIRVSGWEGGLTFLASPDTGVTPWVRAGAIWHRTAYEFAVGEFRSDRELGFQGAVGFDAPLGDMFSISPSVRFNTLRPEFDLATVPPVELDGGQNVQYLSLDLAFKFHLPRN